MNTQLKLQLENVGILAFLSTAAGLGIYGGYHQWSSFHFLLVGAAGLQGYFVLYNLRLKNQLTKARQLEPVHYKHWPVTGGLVLPAQMPQENTLLLNAYAEATYINWLYIPGLTALLVGYLLKADTSWMWASNGLALLLEAIILDRIHFQRAKVTYYRAWAENPAAPFEVDLQLPGFTKHESLTGKLPILIAMSGITAALLIAFVELNAFDLAAAAAAFYIYRKSWRPMTAMRLDFVSFTQQLGIIESRRQQQGA